MLRLVVAAIALAACGSVDDRPQTLAYITESILAPTCGTAACHSTFRQELGYVFDTVDAARTSIVHNALVVIPDNEAAPDQSRLLKSIEVGLPSVLDPGSGNIRMPYDQPMPNENIALIRMWIRSGASGAQCVPEDNDGLACVDNRVVECGDNGNLGATVMTCTGTCANGACL